MLVYFDLNSGVPDIEAFTQFVRDSRQELVARMACEHQIMSGQNHFGRADRPDMKIMH